MRKIQVPAAHNALRILSLLSTIDVPISAARIRSELDLPRSSTYHLLNELVDAGFVVHLPENQTYGLGLAAYAMAMAYTTQQPLARMSHRYIGQAAKLVGGSGHLSRLAGSEIVYLHEVRSPGAVSLVTEVGVRLPALRSASGRVMLAYLPEVEARATFATAGLEASWRQFRERLAHVRERGWEEESEEISRGQASLAVPVLDHLTRPAASLAVTFGVGRLGDATRAAVLDHLQSAAHEIAVRIYGSR